MIKKKMKKLKSFRQELLFKLLNKQNSIKLIQITKVM